MWTLALASDHTLLKPHLDAIQAKYRHLRSSSKSDRRTRRDPAIVQLAYVNALWSAPVKFGGIAVDMLLDTGSTLCVCDLALYNPQQSSTSEDLETNFSTRYLDGTQVSGSVFTDTLEIAGLTAPDVPIVVTPEHQFHNLPTGTGLCGLGQIADWTDYLPFFYHLKESNSFSDNVFAFALSFGPSQMTIGGIDFGQVDGHLTFVDVLDDTGAWEVYGSVAGFSTIITSPEISFGALVQSQDKTEIIEIGDKVFTLSPEHLSMGTPNGGACLLSLVGLDVDDSSIILGSHFFASAYVVFDVDAHQVGVGYRNRAAHT
ncbi:hypothetical protein OC861_005669 [Tilletia horrida]|nr:hypothetical protein OC861_005669 [Tilletia horrida]